MAVLIDSGDFPLLRNVDHTNQPACADVYTQWLRIFADSVPEAVEHLADVIEDVYAFKAWKEYRLDTPEQFFERLGLFDLDLENPAKLIKELRKKRSRLKTKLIARSEERQRLLAQGKTNQQIAAELGVSTRTVQRDGGRQKQRGHTESVTPRKDDRLKLGLKTKPETAARKLLEKFGAQWCRELGKELTNEQP